MVLSDATSSVPVSFTAAADELSKVTVEITPLGSSQVIASNQLTNIKATTLNRVNLGVPFPGSKDAPTGIYTVTYKMTSKAGEQQTGTYNINVVNNLTSIPCTYTSALPTGKTVWVRLYLPKGEDLPANDNTIYITGSFGAREGGTDWDGGNGPHKFTRLSDNCYEIAMHLVEGDQFKITRGTWDKQMTTGSGQDSDNIVYKNEKSIQIIVRNWKDRPLVPFELLDIPSSAVKSGMLTVVADLDKDIQAKDDNYYLVEKGATSLANAIKMVPFSEANKVAAAAPRKAGVEYVVVKGDASSTGKNRYGFAQTATWDGKTNPARIAVGSFGDAAFTLGNKIVMVGNATPGDWGASSGQDYTKTAPGKYSITIDLKTDSNYLLLPEYNQWNDKWGVGAGTVTQGTLASQGGGSDFSTKGLAAGRYKIDVDFTVGTGTYKLTKL